jgi:acetyl-CoA synthetase
MQNKIGNILRSFGVNKGDSVSIYLPSSPIAVASMLACARIGALHSVVFAGFSSESLASRINDGNFYSSLSLSLSNS